MRAASRRLVLAIDVAALPELGPCKIGELAASYIGLGEEIAQHTIHLPAATVHVASPADAEAAGIDLEVREEVDILAAAKARRGAIEAANRGDHVRARAALRAAASELASARVRDQPRSARRPPSSTRGPTPRSGTPACASSCATSSTGPSAGGRDRRDRGRVPSHENRP